MRIPFEANAQAVTRVRRAICVALLALLALLAVTSVSLGAAHTFAELAADHFERWSAANAPVPLREASRVERYLWNSLRFASDNPWALEQFAALDLAKMRAYRDPRLAVAAVRSARARLRRALQLRPTSPYLWANLGLAKLYLDQIDGEFARALRLADELGPWDPAIQQMTVFAGLAAWGRLGPASRREVRQTIARAGAYNAERIFEIVKSFRRFELICADKRYTEIARRECKASAQRGGR